ncbi:TetR/AcrR family transcriptional regulator [Nocardioides sp. W3-2-3]|nr:TetR/AcrR family transcriptional regulator [Nocardioides convexus]
MPTLPRGRHGLSRAEVQAAQRERIFTAMADAMAERGYVATPVAEIIRRAGVSRETFYQQFASKQDCFLAAYDWATDALRTGFAAGLAAEGPPLERFGTLLASLSRGAGRGAPALAAVPGRDLGGRHRRAAAPAGGPARGGRRAGRGAGCPRRAGPVRLRGAAGGRRAAWSPPRWCSTTRPASPRCTPGSSRSRRRSSPIDEENRHVVPSPPSATSPASRCSSPVRPAASAAPSPSRPPSRARCCTSPTCRATCSPRSPPASGPAGVRSPRPSRPTSPTTSRYDAWPAASPSGTARWTWSSTSRGSRSGARCAAWSPSTGSASSTST